MAVKKSSALLAEEYKEQKRLLDNKFSSLAERESESLAAEKAETEEVSAAALRSRYVAERTALRKLPQVAAAGGLSGGAVKSAFRTSGDNYRSAREKLISERDKTVAKLVGEYSQSGEKNAESYAEKLAALKRRYYNVLSYSEKTQR